MRFLVAIKCALAVVVFSAIAWGVWAAVAPLWRDPQPDLIFVRVLLIILVVLFPVAIYLDVRRSP